MYFQFVENMNKKQINQNNIGYACLTVGVSSFNYKNLNLKSFNVENFNKVVNHNLDVLINMLDYNIENNINMFRISSSIIPLASHKINNIDWWNNEKFQIIREKIINNNIRVSMHPGQYTVLNSNNEEVVKASIKELEYHAKFLDLISEESDLILHVGGVYGDKTSAIERFINNYKLLSNNIKNKLVIENDDKSYNVEDVLYINSILNIPVVFDNLHNILNPSSLTEEECLKKCLATWNKKPKIHYSNQGEDKKSGGHSKRINLNLFLDFLKKYNYEYDVMLEVKDKNLSAIKCNNILNNERKHHEKEWAKYKYSVMEGSYKLYKEIQECLKQSDYVTMYNKIDKALDITSEKDFENTLLHVWGYFKEIATKEEKEKFFKQKDQKKSKAYLYKLALKYKVDYLLDSYYFLI